MWTSYHIYNIRYLDFLEKVNILKKEFPKLEKSLFFTSYFDMRGHHYRLRLKTKNITNNVKEMVNSIFIDNEIESRIYDPEILKYGVLQQDYESFSISLTNYLLNNVKILKDKEKSSNTLLKIIYHILNKFKVMDFYQIEKSIGFWKSSFPYIKRSIDNSLFTNLNLLEEIPNSLRKEIEKLPCITNNKSTREFCFNIVHLTINRFNFNMKDECILYLKLYEMNEA